MKMSSFFKLASATTIGIIATSIVEKIVIPIYSTAKSWDDTIMYKVYPNPGKVVRTLKGFYFVCNNGESFKLLDKKYHADTKSTKVLPSWVVTGLNELFEPHYFSNHVGTQAMFSAKYVLKAPSLSAETRQDLKILGIAYFEKATTFSLEQQKILRNAVISRLMLI